MNGPAANPQIDLTHGHKAREFLRQSVGLKDEDVLWQINLIPDR
jgi:HD superfamily phosphohydrolase YqeK